MGEWAKAGVHARPDLAKVRRRIVAKAGNALAADLAHQGMLGRTRERWSRGLVRPYLITVALDSRSLYGPDVDIACMAREPDVDNWEAGILYPSWEQLQALATLTGFTAEYFTLERHHAPLTWSQSSMWFHRKRGEEYRQPTRAVLAFTPESIRTRGLSYP